jgi:hypothetical protein
MKQRTVIDQAMEPNGHQTDMTRSSDHQSSLLDRWISRNPIKAWLLGATTLLAGVGIAFLVLKWDGERTYVVHKRWTTKEIVRVIDPKGKEVDISDSQLKKITYEVIWVK